MSQAGLESDLQDLVAEGSEDIDTALTKVAQAFADNAPHMFELAVGDLFLTNRSGNPSSLLGYGTWSDLGTLGGIIDHVWERTA